MPQLFYKNIQNIHTNTINKIETINSDDEVTESNIKKF